MKVYIVTNNAFPHGWAPANRIICYAKALALNGIDCEVLIYRRTEVYGATPVNTLTEGMYEGVRFKYIPNTTQRASNVFFRQFLDIFDKIAFLKYLKSHLNRKDIVFLYPGTDTDYSVKLCNLAHKLGVKFVYELCELPFGTSKESAYTIKSRHKVEKKLFPIVDAILPISRNLENYASPFVNPSCRMCRIPIMVDFDLFNIDDKSSEADMPYIFHSGRLTDQKDGIIGTFEAFGQLIARNDINLKFYLTGKLEDSPECDILRAIIEKYQIQDKIVFVGNLNSSQVRDYLSKAMMVIGFKHDNQQLKYGFPTKYGEYLAAGKPLILTRVGEPVNWLHDNVDCLMIDAEDISALIDKISLLYSNAQLRQRLGQEAKITCRKCFDVRAVSEKLGTFMCGL